MCFQRARICTRARLISSAEISAFGGWYVESAQCGNTNLLSEEMVVNAGIACAIELTLRNDGGVLKARVETPSWGVQGTALLVPASERINLRSLPFYAADSSGAEITVSGIAPGEYLLYAFDTPEGVEYSNPEVLRSYSSRATPVTISSNQTTKATAQLINTRTAGE